MDIHDAANIILSIPYLLSLILIEYVALRIRNDERNRGYSTRDSLISASMSLVNIVITAVFTTGIVVAFGAIWRYLAPWHIHMNVWWWIVVFITADLGYYFNHRFVHRVRIGWAEHKVHHSSEYFNLTISLRKKWNPWTEAVFWSPLPLLGFEPRAVLTAFSINVMYQFLVHTETVDRLPRFIEFIFNTPSHHRVHHGKDPEYIDKNYGGTLIIWDRIFGTFAEEKSRPNYGLVQPVNSDNIFVLQYGEFAKMFSDVRGAARVADKLRFIFGPPGWCPNTRDNA